MLIGWTLHCTYFKRKLEQIKPYGQLVLEEGETEEECVRRGITELVSCSIIDENQWSKYLLSQQFYPSMKQIKMKLLHLKD